MLEIVMSKIDAEFGCQKNGIGVKMAAKTVVSQGQVAGVPRPGVSKGVTRTRGVHPPRNINWLLPEPRRF